MCTLQEHILLKTPDILIFRGTVSSSWPQHPGKCMRRERTTDFFLAADHRDIRNNWFTLPTTGVFIHQLPRCPSWSKVGPRNIVQFGVHLIPPTGRFCWQTYLFRWDILETQQSPVNSLVARALIPFRSCTYQGKLRRPLLASVPVLRCGNVGWPPYWCYAMRLSTILANPSEKQIAGAMQVLRVSNHWTTARMS